MNMQTLSLVGSPSPLPAPSWKDGNEPECCSFSQRPLTTCWLETHREHSQEECVSVHVLFPRPSVTYVKWCVWWRRQRWRWWGRRARGWTCKRNGSSSFPRSSPPRDSGGRSALHGQIEKSLVWIQACTSTSVSSHHHSSQPPSEVFVFC